MVTSVLPEPEEFYIHKENHLLENLRALASAERVWFIDMIPPSS